MKQRLTDKAVMAAKATPGQRLEIWDAANPGLCLRVTDTGRKTFVLRYRTEAGTQRRLKLGEYSQAFGLADAREAADRVRVQVRDGADPSGEKKRRRVVARAEPLKTFNDLADAFLEASETGLWRPRNKKKRERTVRDERAILDRHIRPKLGALRVEEIDKATVRGLLRAMVVRGIGAQTNRTHAVIRQVFAYGLGEERVTSNPAAGFAPLADEKPRDRVLTDDELKAMWRALEAPAGLRKPSSKGSSETVAMYVGRPMAIALQLAALLLQRRNEIVGMRVNELDLERAVWTIPADRMKGGRAHVVPLPPRAVQLIKEALKLAAEDRDAAPPVVFPGARNPDVAIRPDSLTHTMRDVMAALGLTNASPHDLRRTGATNLVSERASIAPYVVSRVLAHRSDHGGAAAVTMGVYALHDFAPEKRRALTAWENLLTSIVEDRTRDSNVKLLKGAMRT